MVRTDSRHRMSPDEYFRSQPAGPSELVRGEVRMMTPASGSHGVIAGRVFAALYAFVEQHRLGICFPDNTGFLLPGLEDTVRSPDAAYLARARLPADGLGAGWVRAAPNLVVEIASPSESTVDLEAKVQDYLAAGTEIIWIIDPVLSRIVVRTAAHADRVLQSSDLLDGGSVLPGFSVAVGPLFAGIGGMAG
jgi:Uma2 family endonuclease